MKEVDWKSLKHARGPATRLPNEMKGLSSRSGETVAEAVDVVEDVLTGDRLWFSASAPAISLLAEVTRKATHKSAVLFVMANALGADHVRAWFAPPDAGPPADVVAAALACQEYLVELAGDADAFTRASALVVLAMVPDLATGALQVFRRAATSDGSEAVRASALLALGRAGANDPPSKALLTSLEQDHAAPGVVRGAATLCSLRLNPTRSLSSARSGIQEWLSFPLPEPFEGAHIPWFRAKRYGWYTRDQFLSAPSQAVFEIASRRGQLRELLDLVIEMALGATDHQLLRALNELVVELGGFRSNPEEPFVLLPSELPEAQLLLAKRLAATPLLPHAAYGLPAAGTPRRRWLGELPPAALEREVEVTVEGSTVRVPIYRARELLDVSLDDAVFPPALDEKLSGVERWEALVWLTAESYVQSHVIDSEPLELEIQAVADSDDVFNRAPAIADELLQRLAAEARVGRPTEIGHETSALLFLPLVRAGRPIEARWHALIPEGTEPDVVELKKAISLREPKVGPGKKVAAEKPKAPASGSAGKTAKPSKTKPLKAKK